MEETKRTYKKQSHSIAGKYLDPKADLTFKLVFGDHPDHMTSKALSIVEKSAMTEQQLEAYDKFWMSVFDEEAISEGRYLEGREEGEAIGMAKGQEIGRENEKKETARKMKTKGFTDEDIADVTGLTIEEIRKI